MNTITLGLSCSPSTAVSQEEMEVLKIILSYGSNTETLFVKSISDKKGNPEALYFNGHERILNPIFIVSMETIKVVKVVTDVTDHRNHGVVPAKKVDKAFETDYYRIKKDEKWKFKNVYVSNVGGSLGGRRLRLSK